MAHDSWVSYEHHKLATNIRFSVRKYLVSPGSFDRVGGRQQKRMPDSAAETSVQDDEIHKDV